MASICSQNKQLIRIQRVPFWLVFFVQLKYTEYLDPLSLLANTQIQLTTAWLVMGTIWFDIHIYNYRCWTFDICFVLFNDITSCSPAFFILWFNIFTLAELTVVFVALFLDIYSSMTCFLTLSSRASLFKQSIPPITIDKSHIVNVRNIVIVLHATGLWSRLHVTKATLILNTRTRGMHKANTRLI